jgi:hypothetical protein
LKKTKKYIEYKRLNENANIKEDEMDGALNGWAGWLLLSFPEL